MAKLQMNGIVDEVFEGKKGGTYLTVFDEEQGGRIKFFVDGLGKFLPGQHLVIDVVLHGVINQYGQSLNHVKGDFKLRSNS